MKITAVIPLFNKRDTICRAIESVLRQDSLPDELIVINDGSSDGGELIAEELLAEHKFGRVVHTPNQGVSAARNLGISGSTSDYVCLLDADDIWLPSHCATVRRMIAEHPGCGMYVSGNLKALTYQMLHERPGVISVLDSVAFFSRYAKEPGFVHTSAVAVEKSAVNAVGGFPANGIRSQDVYMWLRIAATRRTCVHEGVTAVQLLDDSGLGRRAREVPVYIQYFAQDSNVVAESLRDDVRKILRRGALVSWVASLSAGHDISRKLSDTLRTVDPLASQFFSFAGMPGFRFVWSLAAKWFIKRKRAKARARANRYPRVGERAVNDCAASRRGAP